MKENIKKIICLLAILSMLLPGFTTYAADTAKPISVVVNPVSVKINGKAVKIDNFSYSGKVYLQAQDLTSLLGVGYIYDLKSKSVNISSKKPAKPVSMAKANFASVKASTTKSLKLIANLVVIKLDDKVKKVDNFIYGNSVYIPAKEISGFLEKDYSLDTKTKVLSICEKKPSTPVFVPDTMEKIRGSVAVAITGWGNAQVKEYKIENGAWQKYTDPVVMTSNGIIYARGKNIAGMASDVASMEVNNILTLLNKTEVSKQSAMVVKVVAYDANNIEMGNGSGFIVSDDGKVVTNFHVIDMVPILSVVTSDNKKYPVKGVLAYSVKQDLAVLQLDTEEVLPNVYLGNSDDIQLGEDVVAIGYPLGMQCTVSFGNVSSINTPGGLARTDYKDIQITAPISQGNSGGPTFNMYGEVIGINYSTIVGGQNLNYSIPVNELKPMLSSTDLISLTDVIKEAYPKMDYYQFSRYLLFNYPEFKSGNYSFNFYDIWVSEYSKDPKEVDVYVDLSSKNYEEFSRAKSEGNAREIEKWANDIYKIVKAQYPDKDVCVMFALTGQFDTKPDGYTDSEVSYNENTGMWDLFKPLFIYYYDNGSPSYKWY